MKSKLSVILIVFLVSNYIFSQEILLKSGPMVGYSTMREVKLWLQTTAEADIQINYWEKGNTKEIFKSDIYKAEKNNAFIVQTVIDKVEPGKVYSYEVLINNKKWMHFTEKRIFFQKLPAKIIIKY
jgi:alkaline phosphatase D